MVSPDLAPNLSRLVHVRQKLISVQLAKAPVECENSLLQENLHQTLNRMRLNFLTELFGDLRRRVVELRIEADQFEVNRLILLL